jgi:Rieske Fe-S protein
VKQRISFAQMVGIMIKTYHLEQLVEQQAHMAIFLARSSRNEQTCQLRLFTLPEEMAAQERLIVLGQAQLEMSRIAALRHPVIQPILEYGHEQEMMYLVTPFIPARYALENILSIQGPLDTIQTGHHLERLASGLVYVHKQAIAHGNISASNVFLRPSSGEDRPSTLLLTDVGIAYLESLFVPLGQAQGRVPTNGRALGQAQGRVPTNGRALGQAQGRVPANGHALGQVRGRAPASSRQATTQGPTVLGQPIESTTDIAALGALLYQMLTAHTIFADGRQEPGEQLCISPINIWCPDLPAQLDDVINTACRGRAYRSPSALVDAYYQAIAAESVTEDVQETGLEQGTAPTEYSSQVIEREAVLTGKTDFQRHMANVEVGVASTLAPILSRLLTRRRALLIALAATGTGIVVAGTGWSFLQSQQGSHTAQGSAPIDSVPAGQQTPEPRATSPQAPTHNGAVIAHTANLPIDSTKTFANPNTDSDHPGILIHLSDNRFVAFDTTCTHQSCQVSYNSTTKQLECPCHGAVFDPTRDAAVVAGPAPTALAPIKILVNADGTITLG